MKKFIIFSILAVLFILGCSNNNDELTKIKNDGTGGISCLVNGKILRSRGLPYGSPSEYFGFDHNGNIFYFAVGFHNRNPNTTIYKSIRVQVYDVAYINPVTWEILSLEGNTYQLGNYGAYNLYGEFQTFGMYENDDIKYNTTNVINGEIKITHHDIKNHVISGTFWFDAINDMGEIIRIRDGRFDKIIQGL